MRIVTHRRVGWAVGAGLAVALAATPHSAFAQTLPATQQGEESTRAIADRIDTLVRAAMVARPTAGLSVGVERAGKILVLNGWGRADLENGVRATADTVYCIGSLSKQFGAAAVMRLVEARRVSLEDDLHRWLPDYPTQDQQITVEHLLRHTSGIPDFEYFGDWHTSMAVERTDDELVATFAHLPLLFEPGTRWSYSTSNYYLLGMIVARAYSRPLPEVLDATVFTRAGLRDTQACNHRLLIPLRARGYTPSDGGFRPADLQIQWQFGFGGGICSTVRDLLTWTRALESGRVVSSASYRRMTSGTKLPDGSPVDYGYGLSAYEYEGHRVVAHSGHVAGFSSHLARYPDDDLTIAVLANTDTSAATLVEHQIADLLLGVPPVTAVPMESEALDVYAGIYGLVEGETVKVEPTATGLRANVYGRDADLVPTGTDTFATADRTLVARFVMDGSRPVRLVLDTSGLRFNLEAVHVATMSP